MQRTLLILLALALSACGSTARISRDYDPTVNFWSLRTYTWAPEAEHAGKDVVVATDTLLHQRVESGVDRELAMKGYRKETNPARQPDFWVTFHAAMTRTRDVVIYNNYYGYGYGWGRYPYYPWGAWMGGPDTMVREYNDITLVLDILDPKTRKLIWRATARDFDDESASPQEKTRIIWATIQQMLQGFPPGHP